MSPSKQNIVGLGAGVAAGVLFGELTRYLDVVADSYIKLLQMTVLPYVMLSIIAGLGSLSAEQAKVLARKAGTVLLLLWGIALAAVFLFPLILPPQQTASFFSTTLIEPREPFDFVGLYIPANPFQSLASNIVPAVVLFSVLIGVSLITVPEKGRLLEVVGVALGAVSRVARLVVRLMPLGLFAITATVAGTLSFQELQRLQVYLISYIAIALLLSLWVLPGLVAALTPVSYGALMGRTRDALFTAFMTGSLFVVLPMLIEQTKALVRECRPDREEIESLPDVLVPASFNFPHGGKILALSFVLFAGWFSDVTIRAAEYPRLAATGLLVAFGNINVAIPFLLDLMRVPADTFQLFEATGVINSRFGTLVAAVHTVVIAVLGTLAIAGGLHVRGARLARYLAVTAAVTLATIAAVRLLVATTLTEDYRRDKVVADMQMLHVSHPAREYHSPADVPPASDDGPVLDRIRARGSLRVGYLPDSLPFAYRNASGRLVGFDVEMAHHLAEELGVGLELMPVDRESFPQSLDEGYCDLVMSGVAATPDRAVEVQLSDSYLDETLAFVVRDDERDRYATWSSLRALGRVRLRAPRVPYYLAKLESELPQAEVTVVDEVAELFGGARDSDAIVLTAERGSSWTLLNPAFSVVVPQPGLLKVPLAYAMSSRERRLASFVNTWIELKKKDGTLERLFAYWILGQHAEPRHRRWSVLEDVLDWGPARGRQADAR